MTRQGAESDSAAWLACRPECWEAALGAVMLGQKCLFLGGTGKGPGVPRPANVQSFGGHCHMNPSLPYWTVTTQDVNFLSPCTRSGLVEDMEHSRKHRSIAAGLATSWQLQDRPPGPWSSFEMGTCDPPTFFNHWVPLASPWDAAPKGSHEFAPPASRPYTQDFPCGLAWPSAVLLGESWWLCL